MTFYAAMVRSMYSVECATAVRSNGLCPCLSAGFAATWNCGRKNLFLCHWFLCHSRWLLISAMDAFLENPGEDLVDVAELTLQVKRVLDLASGNAAGDVLVFEHELVEIQILFPRSHGVALNHPV